MLTQANEKRGRHTKRQKGGVPTKKKKKKVVEEIQ